METVDMIKSMESQIILSDGFVNPNGLELMREWTDTTCKSRLSNLSATSYAIDEVILFRGKLLLNPDTQLYGEGYNMLSQYKGSIESIKLVGQYSDRDHYRIPQKQGYETVYNLALLSPSSGEHILAGFASCRKFNGEFRFGQGLIEIVLNTEGLILEPGKQWELEELLIAEGTDHETLLETFADRISMNHPPIMSDKVFSGWCSWYCYGPKITDHDIFANMTAIREKSLDLQYIQIDDGYQAYMGDWLSTHPNFSMDVKSLCLQIKQEGFEPAIWVAPFIAEAESKLFQEHPDWFVQNEQGQPLLSSEVSFGGWRNGPWYMLDGTHPEARGYLRHVFRTIRTEWDCRYFKLDANIWGALHGGYHYDPAASKIEAYRLGMEAVIEGAGSDSFLLGCNAPMWPSLGLVHGMRVTDDISRDWRTISIVAEQGFLRNWQHNRLWINDPDCIVLQNMPLTLIGPDGKERVSSTNISPNEFMFHAAYIIATGGMVLSGDTITDLTEAMLNILNKCLPPLGKSARFGDSQFTVGKIIFEDKLILCLFNWKDEPSRVEVNLPGDFLIVDFWANQSYGTCQDRWIENMMEPRSAKVLIAYPFQSKGKGE